MNATFYLNGNPLVRVSDGHSAGGGLEVRWWTWPDGRFEALAMVRDAARAEDGHPLWYRSLELRPDAGHRVVWLSDPPPTATGAKRDEYPHVLRQRGAIPMRGWVLPGGAPVPPWPVLWRPATPTFAGAERLPCAWPKTPLSRVGPYQVAGQPRGDEPGGETINPYPQHARPDSGMLARLFWILDATIRRTPIFGAAEVPFTTHGKAVVQYSLAARQGITDHTGKKLPSGVITGSWPWPAERAGNPACAYEAELLSWNAPDGQHLIRAIAPALAVLRWADSPLAEWFLGELADDASLAWHSREFAHTPWNTKTLRTISEEVTWHPASTHPALDREFAWVAYLFGHAGSLFRSHAEACADLLSRAAGPSGIPLSWTWAQCADTPRRVYWTEYGAPKDRRVCPSFELSMLAVAADQLGRVLPDPWPARMSALIRRMARSVWSLPLVPSLYGGAPGVGKALLLDHAGMLVGHSGPGESPNPLAILGLGLAHGERSLVRVAAKLKRPVLGVDPDSDSWALPLAVHYPSLLRRMFS